MNWTTKKITTIGTLSAMAMVVTLLIRFPIVPAVPFLAYEPKDVLIVIGGFIYGPMASFLMSVICSFLEIVFRGGTILDVLMNVISTCAFVCPAALFYQHMHTKKGAIIGLLMGTIATTISMTIWNYIVTPVYFNMPREAVVAILLPGIVPFNLIKAGANAFLTMLLYKPIVKFFRHHHMVEKDSLKQPLKTGSIVAITFLAISVVIVILIHKGII